MRVGGPLIQYDWCPYKKGKFRPRDTPQGEHHEITMMATYKAKKEIWNRPSLLVLRENQPCQHPDSDI